MTNYTTDNHKPVAEIELEVEAIEDVIAPGRSIQHNETVEVELTIEDAEEVIAPGRNAQHNETVAIS